MADDDGEWGSIAEAARRLRVTRQAVRGRIRRGTLATRTEVVGNRQRLLVRLPEPIPEPAPAPAQEAELIAELRATIADLRAERDRLLAVIEGLAGERRPWWRRWLGR
jgi:hypothetical protein